MSGQAVKSSAQGNAKSLGQRLKQDFYRNGFKYLIVLPVLVYLVLFCYKPMYGLVIAFKEFRPNLGIAGSPWVGLKHFKNFFTDVYFGRLIRNTFSISILSIVFCFPAPIILALFINEIKNNTFKKTVQTITYMPYFISMVVVCSLVRTYTQQNGLVSQIAVAFGGQAVNWLNKSQYFYPIYIISELWQSVGWNSIIYLAALAGIDQEQYEAARIDGASRMQQLWQITLPNLVPTIMILLILRMGGILNVGFEKIILLYNQGIYEVSDVISTYVYRRGIIDAAYSYSSAVGLFNSLVNIVFLLTTNWLSTRYTDAGLF